MYKVDIFFGLYYFNFFYLFRKVEVPYKIDNHTTFYKIDKKKRLKYFFHFYYIIFNNIIIIIVIKQFYNNKKIKN